MINTLNFRKFLLVVSDIALLYLSLLTALFFGFGKEFDWPTFFDHLLPFSILYLLWLIIFYIFGLYDLNIIRVKETLHARIMGAIFTALTTGLIFFYLFPISKLTPKTNLILDALIFAFLLFIWRNVFLTFFSSRLLTKIAIVKEQPEAKKLIEQIESKPYLGYKLIELETNRDLFNQIKEKKIDVILLPSDLSSDDELIKNLYRCLPTGVKFLDLARACEIIEEQIPISLIDHMWFLENLGEGQKIFYDKLKRGFDIIVSGIIFIITLPLWLLIALSIKIEDGNSIIYKQERIGKDGKQFLLFKFRSMKPEAEKTTGPLWAEIKDRRTTKAGRFLRKIHLDELPQMINVLKGDISLIGPRPERPEFVKELEKEIPHYHLRHIIKPGFTGWAQLKFRYARSIIDSQKKFRYDLYYLKNRSLLIDLGILLKTLQLFFKKE